MANFFYRQAKVGLPTDMSMVRNNAYVTVSGGGFSLPYSGTSHSGTYNPNGSGRPQPILKNVKITMEGEAGSLRKCEVSFVCFDMASFEKAEAALLIPNSEINVNWGYVGPKSPGGSGGQTFRVYDYSFKITKENYFDCSLKAVGKGSTFDELDINGQNGFPTGLKFITDYDGINDKANVTNMFDYIDYAVQVATGTNNSSGFNPPDGAAGPLPEGGHYGILKAPKDYDPPSKLDTGWFTSARVIWVSLGAIVGIVNRYCLKGNKNGYNIQFKQKYCKISYQMPSGKIFAANPIECLLPYAKGTPENRYGKDGWFTEALNIDRFDSAPSISGGPQNILVGRDLLRAIQKAFDDEAKDEKETSEEKDKAKGEMPLNRFFKKLFATIRDQSGGAIDLMLDQDEDDRSTIYIINKMTAPGGGVTPLTINPTGGMNGIRELSIGASVPKEIQAKAFGGSPSVTQEEQAVNVVSGGEAEDEDDPGLAERSLEARKKLHSDKYSQDSISSAKGVVRDLINEADTNKAAQLGLMPDGNDFSQVPFPLTFSAKMDGVEGFRFGDTVTSSYLPSRYRKGGGTRVVFTITKYTHNIEGSDWTTEIEALARIVA